MIRNLELKLIELQLIDYFRTKDKDEKEFLIKRLQMTIKTELEYQE